MVAWESCVFRTAEATQPTTTTLPQPQPPQRQQQQHQQHVFWKPRDPYF